jgi:hypothetical protein
MFRITGITDYGITVTRPDYGDTPVFTLLAATTPMEAIIGKDGRVTVIRNSKTGV